MIYVLKWWRTTTVVLGTCCGKTCYEILKFEYNQYLNYIIFFSFKEFSKVIQQLKKKWRFLILPEKPIPVICSCKTDNLSILSWIDSKEQTVFLHGHKFRHTKCLNSLNFIKIKADKISHTLFKQEQRWIVPLCISRMFENYP